MSGDVAAGLAVAAAAVAFFAWHATRPGQHWVAWLLPPSLAAMFGAAALRWDAGFLAGLAAVTVTGLLSSVWRR